VVGKAVVVVKETRIKNLESEGNKKAREEIERLGMGDNVSEKTVFKSLDDLKVYVGKPLGTSSWTKISQEVIQKFAETTEDFQWIHVDTEKAKALIPGGKNLAHGYLTLSLAPKLLYEILPIEGAQMALNYGVNKVRFPSPVYSGDQVRLKASIVKLEETPDGSIKLFIHAEMESDTSSKPVCVAEMISMVRF
jgi:NADPH:quinone reductase